MTTGAIAEVDFDSTKLHVRGTCGPDIQASTDMRSHDVLVASLK